MLNRRGGRQGKSVVTYFLNSNMSSNNEEIFATTGFVINVIIFFMQVTYT